MNLAEFQSSIVSQFNEHAKFLYGRQTIQNKTNFMKWFENPNADNNALNKRNEY
jgi:hypothetical protein